MNLDVLDLPQSEKSIFGFMSVCIYEHNSKQASGVKFCIRPLQQNCRFVSTLDQISQPEVRLCVYVYW